VGSLTRNFNFYVSSDITGINEINGNGADGTKRYEITTVSGHKLIGNAKDASLAGLAPGLYVVKTLKGSTVVSVSTVVHK
jgi:hypothetical protein